MKDCQSMNRIVVEMMIINLGGDQETGVAITGENIPSTHAESV